MIKDKKPFYSRWWFVLIVIIVVIGIFASIKSGLKNASDKKSTYTWPDTTLVSMIPQPESKYGKIIMENESYFIIDIYKVSKESFEKYIEDCKSSGFTVDYTKYDNYYLANNEEGYSLGLNYNEKEKTLDISLDAPDETSSLQENESISSAEEKANEDIDNKNTNAENAENIGLNEPEETAETTSDENEDKSGQDATEASGDIRPEFKEVLDGYESFMNEYCEFMKKYSESDDIASMAMDYVKMIQEEVEWLEKIDNLEDEAMNAAEAKYYAEVTLRVSQKLIEVSQ